MFWVLSGVGGGGDGVLPKEPGKLANAKKAWSNEQVRIAKQEIQTIWRLTEWEIRPKTRQVALSVLSVPALDFIPTEAVVVDTFAEVRESDVMNLAEEMEHASEMDKKFLQKIFDRMDVAKTGLLSLDDIMLGAQNDPEFQSRLRVMDIDEVDLQQLFEMIDVDGSGAVEAEEFIVPLSRWVHDSKTAPRFIKYNLMHSMQQQDELVQSVERNFELLHARIGAIESKLKKGGAPTVREELQSVNLDLLSGCVGSEAEEIQSCHRSSNPSGFHLQADLALRPAVAVLSQSLSDALKLSVAKMEATLREELRKLEPPRPGPPSVSTAAPGKAEMEQENHLPAGKVIGESDGIQPAFNQEHNDANESKRFHVQGGESQPPRPPNEAKLEWRLSQRLHSV